MGAQRIVDWASEASSALVPHGMELILAGHLEAEGRELCRMVAEYILTCLRSHDPAISLAPMVDGPVAEMEASARESVRDVIDFVAAYFKREPADP